MQSSILYNFIIHLLIVLHINPFRYTPLYMITKNILGDVFKGTLKLELDIQSSIKYFVLLYSISKVFQKY